MNKLGMLKAAAVLLLGLAVLSALQGDSPQDESQMIESAIWPWGDKDFLLFNNTLTVSVDLGEDVDSSRLDMLVDQVFPKVPAVNKIIAAGYIEEDGKKMYYPEKRLIVTRAEFEAHEKTDKDKKVD